MPVIGTYLKKWREDRSVSLESVYEKTRIPLDTLRKLESNQFSDLPKVYIQSFLKSYCREVGIRDPLLTRLVTDFDKDDVIRQLFQPEKPAPEPEKVSQPESPRVEHYAEPSGEYPQDPTATGVVVESNRFERWFHANKWYVVSAIAIALVTWGLLDIFIGSEPEQTSKVTPIDFNQVVQSVQNDNPDVQPVKTVTPQPDTVVKPAPVVKTPERTVLKPDSTLTDFSKFRTIPVRIASGADSTWISLVIDGKQAAAFTLGPNRSMVRSGRHFLVTIGKIDKVTVSANNLELTKPATTGAVFNWVITGPAIQP